MATLLRTDGTSDTVQPTNGQWTEGELKSLVGNTYAVSRTATDDYLLHSDWMALHEELDKDNLSFEELCRWKPFNPAAAKATGYDKGSDWVFGDVLLVPEAEVLATPENHKLFGDWKPSRLLSEFPAKIREYACSSDDCGMVFLFGHTGKMQEGPSFCPFCGYEEAPITVQSMMCKRSIDMKR